MSFSGYYNFCLDFLVMQKNLIRKIRLNTRFKTTWETKNYKTQKQPPRGIPRKRCSEDMQQIYRRTPMLKCDFNKVASQIYWNRTSTWVLSCKFAAQFLEQLFLRTPLGCCFWKHILPNIARSKESKKMKFGQTIRYDGKIIFLQKSCRKYDREVSTRPLCFLKIN